MYCNILKSANKLGNIYSLLKTKKHEKTKINDRLFYCLMGSMSGMAENYYCISHYCINGTKWNI